jgi:hypothetical protein
VMAKETPPRIEWRFDQSPSALRATSRITPAALAAKAARREAGDGRNVTLREPLHSGRLGAKPSRQRPTTRISERPAGRLGRRVARATSKQRGR